MPKWPFDISKLSINERQRDSSQSLDTNRRLGSSCLDIFLQHSRAAWVGLGTGHRVVNVQIGHGRKNFNMFVLNSCDISWLYIVLYLQELLLQLSCGLHHWVRAVLLVLHTLEGAMWKFVGLKLFEHSYTACFLWFAFNSYSTTDGAKWYCKRTNPNRFAC